MKQCKSDNMLVILLIKVLQDAVLIKAADIVGLLMKSNMEKEVTIYHLHMQLKTRLHLHHSLSIQVNLCSPKFYQYHFCQHYLKSIIVNISFIATLFK